MEYWQYEGFNDTTSAKSREHLAEHNQVRTPGELSWRQYIYLITNTSNGRRYIGRTRRLQTRKVKHFADLRRGAHVNYEMQADWNIHGESAFTFEVVERVPIYYLAKEREHFWIREYCSYDLRYGYNLDIASKSFNRR